MRSADLGFRFIGAIVVVGAAGCSTVMEPIKAVRDAIMPSASASAPALGVTTATGAPRATPAAAAASPPALVSVSTAAPADVPVSLESQRAFDDASRALRAGQNGDAERGFRNLSLAHPELGGPHANLGLIYRQAGKLTEAAAELETAVRLSPRQPVYWNQLGVTYRLLGQFKKARDAYDKAIALDPNYAASTLNLGILYDLYLGDGQRALELYGRYLLLSPNGDATVTKWVADLKNRKPAPITVSRKEKE